MELRKIVDNVCNHSHEFLILSLTHCSLSLSPDHTATRAAAPSAVLASTEYVARRIRRHLVDLERTNYTEPSGGGGHYSGKMIEDGTGDGGGDDGDERGGGEGENDSTTGGGAGGGRRKKGGSKAVRALLVYRKTLAGLIEESVRRHLQSLRNDRTVSIMAKRPES